MGRWHVGRRKLSKGGEGMREIKFRGRVFETGQWLYGSLIQFKYKHAMIYDQEKDHEESVEENTIGQFTGLHDKNGVEIYEGDLIRELGLNKTWTLSRRDEFSNRNHIVMWDEENLQWCGNLYEQSALEIYEMDTRPLEFLCKKYTIEVIGNIHEEELK